jgi:hypothetical protein
VGALAALVFLWRAGTVKVSPVHVSRNPRAATMLPGPTCSTST